MGLTEEKGNGVLADITAMLPNNDDAKVIALNIASTIKSKLTAREEAYFIAGFIVCVKYLQEQVERQLVTTEQKQ